MIIFHLTRLGVIDQWSMRPITKIELSVLVDFAGFFQEFWEMAKIPSNGTNTNTSNTIFTTSVWRLFFFKVSQNFASTKLIPKMESNLVSRKR